MVEHFINFEAVRMAARGRGYSQIFWGGDMVLSWSRAAAISWPRPYEFWQMCVDSYVLPESLVSAKFGRDLGR